MSDFKRFQTHSEDLKNQIPGEASYSMNFGNKSFVSGEVASNVAAPFDPKASEENNVIISKIDGTAQENKQNN